MSNSRARDPQESLKPKWVAGSWVWQAGGVASAKAGSRTLQLAHKQVTRVAYKLFLK